MKNVLLTGGSGFIGRNVIPYLKDKCCLFYPDRHKINLLREDEVIQYIKENNISIVIHSANPNPAKNKLDKQETMFEDSIRMFMNLHAARHYYDMMYVLGSGAEFDKCMDISMVTESEEFRSVPYDAYGLAKFTINQIISKSDNICNLRIFGCYGPTDHESKFITHCIHCCKQNVPITIRQNCYFDYIHVFNLAQVLEFFINEKPKFKSYNVASGTRMTLYEIAEMVRKQMGTNNDIVILKDGWNKEYTASNKRLLDEFTSLKLIPLEQGIKMQIESEMGL